MGKLQNCQDVTPWSSQEFAGDGPSNNTLEVQSSPAGYNVPFVGSQTAFYLTIKPDANHTIDRTRIDIHDSSDTALSETLSAINYVVSSPADFSNGIAQYYLYDHADFPDIYEIRLFDAFGDNWNDPNNFVIAQIIMEPDFVMPASNHVISIDFDGKAVGFEPPPPPPPSTPQTDDYVASNFTYDSELFFTNTTASDGFEIFLAHGYESAEFANSLYNLNNNRLWLQFIPDEDTVSNGMVWWPPYFDNNGYYQQYANINNNGFTNGWQDLEDGTNYLESFDPTYYTPYYNTFEQDGVYNASTTEAPHTIETTCGQLFLQNLGDDGGSPHSLNFTNIQFPNHPNGDAQPNRTDAKNKSIIFRWGKSCGNNLTGAWRGLCIEDHPTISPGDIAVSGLTLNSNIYGGGILPSYLEWYISLGENTNYKLSAVPEVIDVWKIITWEDVDDVSANPYGGADPMIDQYPPNMDCLGLADGTSEQHPNFWYKVSDSTTNESDLDINNIQLFSVNNTTVRMRIPFKSGLSLERYTPTQFIQNHRRENKIFINIYPLLIT